MKKIQTVFFVNDETYAVDGSGQDAAQAAIDSFPDQVVVLHGFMVDGRFKKADLTSHWERTAIRKAQYL